MIFHFYKLYENFFYWAGLTEEEFIQGIKPKNKLINYRAEWRTDYENLPDLICSFKEIIHKLKEEEEEWKMTILILMFIDCEDERITEIIWNQLSPDEIISLAEIALKSELFESQRQIIIKNNEIESSFKIYLNNLFLKRTNFIYIKNYIENQL